VNRHRRTFVPIKAIVPVWRKKNVRKEPVDAFVIMQRDTRDC